MTSKLFDKNAPASSAALSQGYARIIESKIALAENMLENHVMDETSSGVYDGTGNGKHHKVDLYARSSGDSNSARRDVTTVAGYGINYVYETSTTTQAGTYKADEWYYAYPSDSETSSSTKLQITRAGKIHLDNGRLTNNTALKARNYADSADISLIQSDENNNRLIPGDLVVSGTLLWDSEVSYAQGAVVRKVDATQGDCFYISLTTANLNNDPALVANQYGEDDATNPVWERLLKRRDQIDRTSAGNGIYEIFGAVTSGGAQVVASDDWTVSKTATGRYQLNITKDSGSNPKWVIFAMCAQATDTQGNALSIKTTSYYFSNNVSGNILIEGTDEGVPADAAWYFIAYRIE